MQKILGSTGETVPVLSIKGLTVRYSGRTVLEDVSFDIAAGESVGLAGESGSGKSTLARTLMRILPPDGFATGQVHFEDRDLLTCREREMEPIRGARMSLIAQEPKAALNPVLRCGWQVREVIAAHMRCSRAAARELASRAFDEVGLPAHAVHAYPHELSGGQLQRVVIAQALVCGPALVLADEPTAAVDTVTQAGLIDLLRRLRERRKTAFLFITHNPRLLTAFATRVLTLRDGRLSADA